MLVGQSAPDAYRRERLERTPVGRKNVPQTHRHMEEERNACDAAVSCLCNIRLSSADLQLFILRRLGNILKNQKFT